MTEPVSPPSPAGPRASALALLLPLLCLAGSGIAAYLSVVHYGLLFGRVTVGDVCGGGMNDCHSVIASRFGRLAGLPVSVWGLWYYVCAGALSLAVLLLGRDDRAASLRALWWLTMAALLFDAYLGWAMWARLERLCPLCVATYVINLAMLAIVGVARGRLPRERASDESLRVDSSDAPPRDHAKTKTLLAALAVAGVLVTLGGALFVSNAAARVEKRQLASLLEYVRTTKPIAISTEGRPSRGPANARVTLVVFSDFLCEQCKRSSRYLDIVAANHRDDVRIVHRHFPADSLCNPGMRTAHPGACNLARAAECAWRQGRFWEFHDAVFADPRPVRANRIALYRTRAALDSARFEADWNDSGIDAILGADVAAAHAAEIDATPAVFVNGRAIVGALKPWLMEKVIEAVEALPPEKSTPGH